jgi:hypothetical protein
MKNIKSIIGLVIISLLFINAKSENPCGVMTPNSDTSSWGIGFIRLNSKVQIKGLTQDNKECLVGNGLIILENTVKASIENADFIYLADVNTVLLKVREVINNKYRIGTNSIKGGVWIELKELQTISLNFETYCSFIQKYKNIIRLDNNDKKGRHINMGVNLLKSCLYLRDEPNVDGKIITCIQNNLHDDPKHTTTHLEIQKVVNGWAQVKVRIYVYDEEKDPQPDECAITLIKEYLGYVKVIGNKGIPNIWYAISAY